MSVGRGIPLRGGGFPIARCSADWECPRGPFTRRPGRTGRRGGELGASSSRATRHRSKNIGAPAVAVLLDAALVGGIPHPSEQRMKGVLLAS